MAAYGTHQSHFHGAAAEIQFRLVDGMLASPLVMWKVCVPPSIPSSIDNAAAAVLIVHCKCHFGG